MPDEPTRPRPLVRHSDVTEEGSWSHPFNPRSEIRGVSLSQRTGMVRLGLHLVRIAPGKEANIYHAHHGEEEFFYILEGRGIAEIDGAEYEVGPGDFLGFPTPSVAHHLKNPFDEELVYLVGGERHAIEVADFPGLGKRVIRVGREAQVVDVEQCQPFWKADG